MKKHIEIFDFFRGIAALGVVLFHYSNSHLFLLKGSSIAEYLKFGRYGVDLFFIISGFIIPFSISAIDYKLKDFYKFFLKRTIRIVPVAYAVMLFVILFYYGAYFVNGKYLDGVVWPGLGLEALVSNLFFIVPYMHSEWFEPVFWTLSIEFEYYIIIGLLFPFFRKVNSSNLTFVFVLFSWLQPFHFASIFNYIDYFLLGYLLYLSFKQEIKPLIFYAAVIGIICHIFYINEITGGVLSILALLLFKFYNKSNYLFSKLGNISYSLYVIHPLVGYTLEIIFKRFFDLGHSDFSKIFFILFFTLISVGVAQIFHLLIEKPILKLSKSIKY